MENKIRFSSTPLLITYLMVVMVLASCQNKQNAIKIASKNFDKEILTDQSLNFTFSQNVAPDSLLDKWLTTIPINISPAVEGRCKWSSNNELTFTPAEKFSPATHYKIELNTKEILAKGDKKLFFEGDMAWEVSTPSLQLTNVFFHWGQSPTQPGVAQLTMTTLTNYALNPADLLKYMKVVSNGSTMQAKLAKTDIGEECSFIIDNAPQSDDDVPVKISIDKGMQIPFSKSAIDNAITFETILPSKNKLSITGISTEHNGTTGMIVVNTSAEVTETNLANHIAVEPKVEFTAVKNENGFTVQSEKFEVDNTYKITVKTTLLSVLGARLKEDYTQDVIFGKLAPAISFANTKAMYLGANGNKNILVNISSVAKVKMRIYKIYENNIQQFMERGNDYGYHYEESEEEGGESNYWDYQYFNTDDYGDLIVQEEFETRKLQKKGELRVFNLNFEDKIKNMQGLYVLQLEAIDKSWVTASKIISISDIGLIVKQSPSAVMVFANSIKTSDAMSGVKINFTSGKNQTIKTAITNSDGMAVLEKSNEQFPDYQIGLVTASIKDDFNFIKLNANNRMQNSRFDIGGKHASKLNYDAFLYGDRDLYRPGEKIILAGIVRDKVWNNPGGVPVVIKIFLPNGHVYKTIKKILDVEGAFETSIQLPEAAITGSYRASVYIADDILLASRYINIEEFMPDKIAVKLKTTKDKYEVKDSVVLNGVATNLFGPPAANRNYKVEFSLSHSYFSSKTYSDYNFSLNNFSKSFNLEERNGVTLADGSIREAFYIDAGNYNRGLLQGKLFTVVFDESGRPVNRENYVSIHTQPYYVGLKTIDSYVGLDLPLQFAYCAVDVNDKPVINLKTKFEIIKRDWYTVMEKYGNGYRYNSQQRERVVYSTNVAINKNGTATYIPKLNGEYEARLYTPGSSAYVSSYFYAYRSGYSENNSFETNNEGNVEIESDKDEYNTNDEVKLLFKTPFAGKLIVTLEQDRVIKYYSLKTDNKSAVLNFKLANQHVPNVHIGVTLIRAQDDGSNPLIVAHGYKNIIVKNPEKKLAIKIEAPTSVRSRSKQTINIKTKPNTAVAVAVVDEGILQIKNYESPDPYKYFYQPRALEIQSYDIYPSLFPEVMLKKSYSGGDGFDMAKRVNPITNKRVKLVALWSGLMKSDGSGNAKFDIDIPQFNGNLRIMAVAYTEDKFGAADTNMIVADPIVINSGLPRFASPGDSIIMPITLSNTTKKDLQAIVTTTVSGPFAVSASKQNVTIKANNELRAFNKITALKNIGAGKITVTVNAGNETFIEETDMTVRPPSSLQKISGSGILAAGKSVDLNVAEDLLAQASSSKIIVSRSPVCQLGKSIEYLIQYPYGCVEQTTSAAFPQLYYNDLAREILQKGQSDPNPNYNVMQAIAKLQSMQMSSGALTYWPGGDYESWFGTVYALHFLIEAKKAGFDVDKDVQNRMTNFIIRKLGEKITFKYYYNSNQVKDIAPKEVAYSLYVLALAGKPQTSIMNHYKSNLQLLSLDSKYLLASAYSITGNKMAFSQILPPAFSGEVSQTVTGGSFYSPIRDEAIALNALIEADANNSQIPLMSKHVTDGLKLNRYCSTQEHVFGFLALGKLARNNRNNNATATVMVNGKPVGNCGMQNAVVSIKDLRGKKVSITSSGQGSIFYYFVSEGLSMSEKFKQEDSYMAVRKFFYDRNGNAVSNLSFKQNDLVVIKLSIRAMQNTYIDNVVITDILPAGFEIENPRLSATTDYPWIRNMSTPQYMDIRDDRINLFSQVYYSQQDFYYMVRCVTKGTFKMGPVSADAMYNGEYHSYNGAGVVTIY